MKADAGVRKRGLAYDIAHNKGAYLLVLPGILVFLINNYLPMVFLSVAFKDIQRLGSNIFDTFLKNPWAGLENFGYLFASKDIWIITRNTLAYNFVFIFLGIFVAVVSAIALTELRSRRLSKAYQSIMMFPHFVSWVVISYIVYAFFAGNGIINKTLLPAFGLDGVSFYSQRPYWPFILTFVHLWYSTGSACIMYMAAITGINGEYYEAATIDGASKWQQITKITLPFLRPTIITLTIISLGGIFHANFGLFYNVPRESGILFEVTNVIDTYVYRALRMAGGNFEMAAAAGFFQSIVGFVVVLAANGVIRKISADDAMF